MSGRDARGPEYDLSRQHRLADDLRAVHQAAQALVEGVAAMHDAAVVPQHQVAGAPLLVPGEVLLGGMGPYGVEERLALLDRRGPGCRRRGGGRGTMPFALLTGCRRTRGCTAPGVRRTSRVR